MAVSGSVYRPNIDRVIDENNPFFGYVSTLERALEEAMNLKRRPNSPFIKRRRTLELLVSSRAQTMQISNSPAKCRIIVLSSNWWDNFYHSIVVKP